MNARWKRPAMLVCVGIGALAVGTTANGMPSAASGESLVVRLKAKHGSGISGTATLIPVGDALRVVLKLTARARGPAHLHTGPCKREPTFANPRISSGLNNVVRGRSTTLVRRTSLARLRAGVYSINVHDANTYGVTACADIPRG